MTRIPPASPPGPPAPVDPDSLGGQLLALRRALGLSQAKVAAFIAVPGEPLPIERIQHWERNRRQPRERHELLRLVAGLYKLNPALVSLEAIEKLIYTYQPGLPLTAEERAAFFPDIAPSAPARAASAPKSTLSVRLPAAGNNDSDLSPFVAGRPISTPRQFFGRTRELTRLFNLLRRRPLQNAAVVGDRHSGKTSLLHYLARITSTPAPHLRPGQRTDWLARPERYRWIYVDFHDPQLATQEGVLRYLLAQMGLTAPEPCTMRSFSETVRPALGMPTVILLDDIGVALQHYADLNYLFWEGLRALALHQVEGNLGFVLTAHEPFVQLAQNQVAGSPFFTIFGYTTTLEPLLDSEARELIASSPVPFAPADVEWILEHSERQPMRLQILCRERLLALETGERGSAWQREGLRQLALVLTTVYGPAGDQIRE